MFDQVFALVEASIKIEGVIDLDKFRERGVTYTLAYNDTKYTIYITEEEEVKYLCIHHGVNRLIVGDGMYYCTKRCARHVYESELVDYVFNDIINRATDEATNGATDEATNGAAKKED